MRSLRWLLPVTALMLLAGCNDGDGFRFDADMPESGLYTITSSGIERTYYLDVPSDYRPGGARKPLIIGWHGTGGSHELWLDGHYPLREAVGDGAILVYPDALPTQSGINQWNQDRDLQLFEDLLDDLPVKYDPKRVFVTGHSSGAGLTHELGCHHGDRIRAIAPVAGSLTSSSCTGAVAVMQIHGTNDTVVPIGLGQLGRRFWVLYNGFALATSGPGTHAPCIDYSLGASAYAVQWCAHDEGEGAAAHGWPTFAAAAMWEFFSGLPDANEGTAPPPGGGNERAQVGFDTTMSFTLKYPEEMATPIRGAIVLYEEKTTLPVTAPIAFLSLDFPAGSVTPGEERSYEVPIRFADFGGTVEFPGTYTVLMTIFAEGGGYPMPVSGVDLWSLFDWTFNDRNEAVEIPGVLELETIPEETGT